MDHVTTSTARDAAQPTTLAEIRDLATLPIHSEEQPSLAGVLGVSRAFAYTLAARGEVPTIRLGRRLLVPVPALLRMLGAEQ